MVIKRHTLTQNWEYVPILTKLLQYMLMTTPFQMQNKLVKMKQCTLKYIQLSIYTHEIINTQQIKDEFNQVYVYCKTNMHWKRRKIETRLGKRNPKRCHCPQKYYYYSIVFMNICITVSKAHHKLI